MAEIFQLCNVLAEKDFNDDSPYRYRSYNNDDGYTANIKFDGVRIMAKCENGEVILINRNKRACNSNFPEIVKELEKLKGNFILDGEIISQDDDFDKVQKRILTKDKEKQEELIKEIPVCFMVFDILKYEDTNTGRQDLRDRMKFFKKFEIENIEECAIDKDLIKVAEFLKPKEMYNKAKLEKREGIVIKSLNYSYREGRTDIWYKVKFFKEEIFEAISYTENPKGIRVEDKDGNSCQISNREYHKVKELIDKDGKALINIQYLEKTKDNKYRFPSFRGRVKSEEELKEDEEDEDE